MKKRIFALLLAFIMLVGMLPVQAFAAATEIPVNDNLIDITNTEIGRASSKRRAYAVDIHVSGATVLSASEDGLTVDVVLSKSTNPNGKVSIEFGTELGSKLTMEGTTASTALSEGQGTISAALTAKKGGQVMGTKTYTVNFAAASDDVCEVSLPTGTGYTVIGAKTATANSSYSFQVAVDEAYDGHQHDRQSQRRDP